MVRAAFLSSLSITALTIGLLSPRPAAAQEAAPSSAPDTAYAVEDIVVTAQLRSQPLQSVPLPINAYTGEVLEDLRIEGLSDLSHLVPGLEVLEQTIQNPNFVIRGVSSGGSSANIENRISVFQDGISISRAQGALTEMFDLQQVEVLKGPQGTLYGRGSTAGAISTTSARPDFSGFSGEVRGGVESYDGRRAGLVLNMPLSDTLAVRAAVSHRYREGFIRDVVGDRYNGGRDMTAGRLSGTVLLGERVDATLIVNAQRDRSNSNVFASITMPLPGQGFASQGDNAPWNRFTNRTDPFGDMGTDLGDQAGIKRDVIGGTLIVNADLGDVKLSSLTGYRYLASEDYFDVDGSPVFIVNGLEDTRLNQYSTELRAVYDAGGRLSGVAGVSVFHEVVDYLIYLDYAPNRVATLVTAASPFFRAPVNASGVLNPALPLGLPARAEETNSTKGATTSWSAYVDGAFKLTDRATLSAGVRYTRDDKDLDTLRPRSNLGLFYPTPTGDVRSRSGSFDAFQPRAVLDYRWTSEVMTYASVATGYRSGILPEAGANNTNPPVEPEYVVSYELGARTTALGGRLRLNGSVFYYDWTDFQTQVINPDTNLPISANAGEASALGLELEGRARLGQGFSLFGNMNLMDAKYDSFVSGGQNFSGNRLTYSPKARFTLGFTHDAALPDGWAVKTSAYASYRSLQYFSNENSDLESQKAFTLVNGSITLSTPWRAEMTVYADNLFNQKYLGDAGNTGRAFGSPTWVPGHPRVVGVELSSRF